MDDNIYDLIESPDPKDRKRAIKMLAQDGSQEAVKVLAQLYKQETDPEIKDLAVKAGQYIKKQQQAAKWEGGGRSASPEPEAPRDEPEIVVSSARQEQAKGLMEQAMNLLMQDNRTKAVALARKAFQLNPNLRRDSYYMGVANEITGRDTEETLHMLMSAEPVDGKEKAKRKNDDASSDDATWGEAFTDLAIYGLVNAAIVIVGMLLFIQLLSGPMREAVVQATQSPQYTSDDIQAIQTFSNVLGGVGIIVSIFYGAIYGIASIAGLLIQLFFVHIAAKMVLGGDGTFPGLIRKVTNFFTVMTVLWSIFVFVFGFLSINSLVNNMMTATSEAAAVDAMSGVAGLYGIFMLIAGIGSLVMVFMYAARIGQAYDFGTGKGCLSIFISAILMSVASCAIQLACSSIIQQAFANAMMNSYSGF